MEKSDQFYRLLVEAVSAVTWSCPASGLQDKPQPQWMAFTGQSAEEMLGQGWIKAVHPDDVEEALSRWQAAAASGMPFSNEHRVRRHDGQWRWMSARCIPIRDDSGEIVEWFGMNLDITERKEAEEALRELNASLERRVRDRTEALRASEERFRLFMDNSPAIAWMKDEEGHYRYINETVARQFNMPAEDWIGKTDAELWPADVTRNLRENDLEVLATGRPIEDRRNARAGWDHSLLAQQQISVFRQIRQAVRGRSRAGCYRAQKNAGIPAGR